MGTVSGPGVSWWDSFYTLLDPSSNLLYPGTGFTFSNPLIFKRYSDWTMTDNTNLITGTGISKYVKQTSKSQFTQKITQTDSYATPTTTSWSMIMIIQVPSNATDGTLIQVQSNSLSFGYTAQGELQYNNAGTVYTTSGLGLTDNRWRHIVVTRSGTAVSYYINGNYNQNALLAANNNFGAADTKIFDYPGSDVAVGLFWLGPTVVISPAQVLQHYRAFRGRFGLR